MKTGFKFDYSAKINTTSEPDQIGQKTMREKGCTGTYENLSQICKDLLEKLISKGFLITRPVLSLASPNSIRVLSPKNNGLSTPAYPLARLRFQHNNSPRVPNF